MSRTQCKPCRKHMLYICTYVHVCIHTNMYIRTRAEALAPSLQCSLFKWRSVLKLLGFALATYIRTYVRRSNARARLWSYVHTYVVLWSSIMLVWSLHLESAISTYIGWLSRIPCQIRLHCLNELISVWHSQVQDGGVADSREENQHVVNQGGKETCLELSELVSTCSSPHRISSGCKTTGLGFTVNSAVAPHFEQANPAQVHYSS